MDLMHLTVQNPWWKNPAAIRDDEKLKKIKDSILKWSPRLLSELKFDRDRIYTLRGPRQVGKTTLVKLIIRELLAKTEHSQSIFYFTCDLVADEKELFEVLNLYLNWVAAFKLERKYIFLDEISSVRDWEKGLKYIADTGALKNSTVVLTGSHSIDIKNSIERLPGRRGEGEGTLDKIFFPMKFSEYAETLNPDLKQFMEANGLTEGPKRQEILSTLLEGRASPLLSLLLVYQSELDRLFDQYLITGGIPRAINEFFSKNKIDSSIYEIYIQSLIGDLARWNIPEMPVKQVLRSISGKLTTQVSWRSITDETDIGAHVTVQKYVTALEDSFVLNVLYPLDLPKKTASFKKEKKIYFQDPFIFHALHTWASGLTDYFESANLYLNSPETRSKLVESVFHSHLVRFMYEKYPSDVFSPHDCIFYLKTKGGKKEVDFVLKTNGNQLLGIELKYQSQINSSDYRGLTAFERGILVSKNKYDFNGKYATVPISILLLLL
ncbi:ATP-binding protein [Methanosarcina sp. KYL-1]|uniref:ATP-binding protein n=1 Tax=Methanosarcina sp. KYL-1 TaxID=2602068 RepID=UPI002100688C|nr:ATP-binding protein [Methanosarcina sp. KYL-1]MCQ1535701.1 ATP-binding protein [Methanosarcina sp. KYL-1]